MHIQNLSSLCGIAKKIASSRTIPHPVGGICKMIKTVAVEYVCDGFVFFSALPLPRLCFGGGWWRGGFVPEGHILRGLNGNCLKNRKKVYV